MKKITTRNIVIGGLLLALTIVLDLFSIQIPFIANKIKFTFIPNMVFASLYNLPMCLLFGLLYDTISFVVMPSGSYFFGYTLSKMLTMAIFWFFLHKKNDLKNIILSKSIINIFINAGLGSLWLSMMLSKGFTYYFSTSIVKNLVMLPIEIFVMFTISKGLNPLIQKEKLNK